MNKRLKYILFSVLVLVLILFYLLIHETFFSEGHSGIQISDTASVSRIELYGNDTIILVRSGPGQWILNQKYKANPVCVSNFLYSFKNMNVRGMSYDIDPRDTSTVRIRVFAGKKKQFFRFYPADGNNLIHREGDKKIFSVEVTGTSKANLSQVFSDDPDYWKDRTIMDFLPDEISVIDVQDPGSPGNDFIIRMENKTPVLYESDGKTKIPEENLDEEKISMYTSYFINIFFDYTVKDSMPSMHYFSKTPDHIITVVPKKGESVKMYVYPIITDGQADIFRAGIRVNENHEILVARYLVIDLLLLKKSDFFRK